MRHTLKQSFKTVVNGTQQGQLFYVSYSPTLLRSAEVSVRLTLYPGNHRILILPPAQPLKSEELLTVKILTHTHTQPRTHTVKGKGDQSNVWSPNLPQTSVGSLRVT